MKHPYICTVGPPEGCLKRKKILKEFFSFYYLLSLIRADFLSEEWGVPQSAIVTLLCSSSSVTNNIQL